MHARGPCIFCGEPYRFESPIKITRFHFRILGGLGIVVFVILFARCLQSTSYVQTSFLRGPEMRKATAALGRGQTEAAREAAAKLYQEYWYSGLPGVVIAASHYRDYMKSGQMSSLDQMERYVKKAHDTDPCFATRYYYGLWLLENREYDEAIEQEGANPQNAKKEGIGRVADTVVKPMNRDGLLDPIFMHPRLLAAVRHVLGVHCKYIGSNYHCALPGYGHQGIHADFAWGIKGEPEVVNAVWLIDEFNEDNGATRIVPGTHLSGIHPSGDLVNDKPRDLNAPVEGEIRVTGPAGSCFVYNAHLWHGGTQNCTNKLRRAQHAFFSRSHRPSSTDVPAVIDEALHKRLGRVERAVLDIEVLRN